MTNVQKFIKRTKNDKEFYLPYSKKSIMPDIIINKNIEMMLI